jgi:uncharacterized protein YcbX
MTQITLSEITLYPVKSLAGITVKSWPVTKTGLLYDRKWMLIDTDQQFLSQRKLPKMALIQTALTDSPEADQWLSHFLNLECRLVYQGDNMIRPVDHNYSLPTDQVSFSDGFPFLIISESSLASLNHIMQLDLPMSRFRPNLTIANCPSYAEDSWREIRIGDIDFRLPKPCSRCSVPTINPKTAEIGKEPLTTLNRVRKWEGKIYFGQNALHNNCGVLSVGDIVQVKVTGTHQPPI